MASDAPLPLSDDPAACAAEIERARRAATDAACVAAMHRLAAELRALPPAPVADLRAALAGGR